MPEADIQALYPTIIERTFTGTALAHVGSRRPARD